MIQSHRALKPGAAGLFRLVVLLVLFLAPHAVSTLTSVAEGDSNFLRMDYPAAAELYRKALTGVKEDAEVHWRLARLYVCMGDVANRSEREQLYRTAEDFANKCLKVDSTKGEGHTWRAAALGNIAMFLGSKAKVQLANEIKRELDVAISLNPKDDIALSILGSFYRAMGNISWIERQLASIFLGSLPDGGYEDAERVLRQAISLASSVMRHYFELGLLLEDMDEEEKAREAFLTASRQPVVMASDNIRIQRIKKRLEDGEN